jgi:hypothetical protein
MHNQILKYLLELLLYPGPTTRQPNDQQTSNPMRTENYKIEKDQYQHWARGSWGVGGTEGFWVAFLKPNNRSVNLSSGGERGKKRMITNLPRTIILAYQMASRRAGGCRLLGHSLPPLLFIQSWQSSWSRLSDGGRSLYINLHRN